MTTPDLAIMRLSLVGGGEFIARWPARISAFDLRLSLCWIDAVLSGWIADFEARGEPERRAADVEYLSWFADSKTPNAKLSGLGRCGSSATTDAGA